MCLEIYTWLCLLVLICYILWKLCSNSSTLRPIYDDCISCEQWSDYFKWFLTSLQTRQTRYVSQLEVLDWNSAGKTSSPAGIVDCMVHADNEQRRNGDTPIVVHCRLGLSN